MNLDKLKSVIQAANPSILDLKFGCEFEFPNSGNKMERWIVTSSYGSVDMLADHESISIYARRIDDVHSDIFSWDSPEDFQETGQTFYDLAKILGRPIRLADVLSHLKNEFFPIGYAFMGGGKRQIERQVKSTKEFEKKLVYEL